MNNKKKISILGIVLILLLVLTLILYIINKEANKEYFTSIDYNKLEEKIKKEETFVVVISQSTCSHCADYKPIVDEIANEYKINIYYTDIDKYTEENKEKFDKIYNVKGTPTTIFIINGKEESIMNRISGTVSKEQLIENLKKHNIIK